MRRVTSSLIITCIIPVILCSCSLSPKSEISTNSLTEPSASTEASNSFPSNSASPEAVSTSPTDQTSQDILETGVPWDLYPGLKQKIDELVHDKSCELLQEIGSEYVQGKDKNLQNYLAEAETKAGC